MSSVQLANLLHMYTNIPYDKSYQHDYFVLYFSVNSFFYRGIYCDILLPVYRNE